MTASLDNPAGYLTVQFLDWVSEQPRTYGDAMDAWRTSCLAPVDLGRRDPRRACENGEGGGPMRQSLVMFDRPRPDRAENAQRRGALNSIAK